MSWFYILFLFTLGIFVLKTLLSTIFGDTDIDFDADGDIDFDVSSAFSFKGALHFLLGFSSFLSLTGWVNNINTFSIYQYIIAFIIGIVFMFGLFYIYVLAMKLNHHNDNNPNFDGCHATILTKYDNGWYDVLIKTYTGTIKRKLNRYDNHVDFEIGDECIVRRINSEYYLINV